MEGVHMAKVKIIKNIFSSEIEEFDIKESVTIEKVVREHTVGDEYSDTVLECYDAATGETFFKNIEEDVCFGVVIFVNGKEEQLDYVIKADDEIAIAYTPFGGGGGGKGTFTKFLYTAAIFTGAVLMASNPVGWGAFAVGALFVGAGILGWGSTIYNEFYRPDYSVGTSDSGIQGNNQPDVRGSKNQSIIGQSIPFVIGKHLTVPFIAGSTYNILSGEDRSGIHYGEKSVIHALYVVGYTPLRISDLKLGDIFLAHNQPWANNATLKNIFHGKLTGIDRGEGTGDIVNKWANNDISLEILQQGQNGEAVDYGEIYPYARLQENVDANLLFIADGALDDGELTEYKGLALANGLRNNRVQFTEQCPKKITVELNAPSGLYKTRSETESNNSRTHYRQIPLWMAIQWRVYSEVNDESDGKAHGVFEESYDPVTNTYGVYDETTQTYIPKRSWHSFNNVNGLNVGTYTAANRNADIAAHTGNNGLVAADINNDWIDAEVFNFQSFCGTDDSHIGISEIRFQTTVDLEAWARENLVSAGYTEDEFIRKFKSYFLDGSNTNKCIEVRCVRVSPCYLNETVSTSEHSAYNFNDIIKWKTLTTEPFDKDKLEKDNELAQIRPIPEDLMRKLCIISLEAKVDSYDQISGVLNKLSCTAESFSPFYDDETKRWVPENICKIEKFYKPRTSTEYGEEITKAQFEEDRQNGIKSERVAAGNDYVPNLVNNVIRIDENKEIVDEHVRYFIPETLRPYYNNNVASMFLLAAIGPQNGVDALGYSQSDYDVNGYGDFDLNSFSKWFKWAEDVTDGSTYPTNGWHYDHNGNRVQHVAGATVHMYFTANAYLYNAQKLETVMAGIAIAGRAVFTYDSNNRLTIVIDKPEKYPVALINQQNTLESSYTLTFDDKPSGLQFNFPDEDDGYIQNVLYCMADGEKADSPKKAIENYEFKFVTNSRQLWSLGRYLLANRILNREVITKKLGIEGYSIGLGNLVLVQDDTMLVGTDTGGRITKLIEDSDYIYGFLINNTYHYTGETEVQTDNEGNPVLDDNDNEVIQCKCGVVVMQPLQYKASRIITLRLAMNGTSVTVGEETYSLVKGNTNVVLFANRISKNENSTDGSDYYVYTPKVENIVGFGYIGKTTATYRVTNIKKDDKHHFTFTLSKYQEELYNYGRELPSFQNNMTVPDRSGEDSFALSENATFKDLNSNLNQAANIATGTVMDNLRQVPSTPTIISAKAERDGIAIDCSIASSDTNLVDYIVYYIEKEDGTHEEIKGRYSASYLFNRTVDGYPEASNLLNWQVKVKAVSVFKDDEGEPIESEWSEFHLISTLSYGTWIVQAPSYYTRALDRTITIVLSQPPRSDTKTVYGTIRYRVEVKRLGDQADDYYYKPDLSSNPYPVKDATGTIIQGNEDNYKDSVIEKGSWESDTAYYVNDVVVVDNVYYKCKTAHTSGSEFDATEQENWDEYQNFVYSESVYVQTMPLIGQGTKQIENTRYSFRVYAENEAGTSASASEIQATAICTNIQDIVAAKETAKEAYITELSSIVANLGVIKQGGLSGSDTNYWALSNIIDDLGNRRYEGEFRVGNADKYLKVEAIAFDEQGKPTDYKLTLATDNFEVLTESTNFNKEIIVYSSETKLDRIRITPESIFIEHRDTAESIGFKEVCHFNKSGIWTPSFRTDKWIQIGNFTQSQMRSAGHDIGRQYLTTNAKVWHFDEEETGQQALSQNGITDGLVITPDSSDTVHYAGGKVDEGGAIVDYSPAILAVAPFCSKAQCCYGLIRMDYTELNTQVLTVDFWIQFKHAEAQSLFDIGTTEDRIKLEVLPQEPLPVVSGPASWRPAQGSVVWTHGRNPKDGDYVYDTQAQAEAGGESSKTVSAYTLSEGYSVATITVNGTSYSFDTGDPDYNFETFAPDTAWEVGSCVAVKANNTQTILTHYGQVQSESVNLETDFDRDRRFQTYTWYHIGIVFNENHIKFLLDNTSYNGSTGFNRYSTSAADIDVQLNPSKKSIIIDELYIDKADELVADFIAQTTNRYPWAALSQDEDGWFIFDAKDPSKVRSNILDYFKAQLLASDEFRDKVLEITQ